MHGLSGIRVVDFTSEIAGPYATKLFADAGAEVVKVETPDGDPLRRWSATGGDLEGRDAPFFRFLNASKRSVVGAIGDAAVDALIAAADLVVDEAGHAAGPEREAILARHPGLVWLSITPWGLTGPWADRPATEFIVQAECGSVGTRGLPGGEPYQCGGRTTEWIGGTFAAVSALAAVRRARETGHGELVDFSLQEVMGFATTNFLDLMWGMMGRPPVAGSMQSVETPSIEPTRDGYVGFNTNTGQQISDFLLMIERPEFRDTGEFNGAAQRSARLAEWEQIVHGWTQTKTTAEIVELATLLRIPVAPIGNGSTVAQHEQLVARGVFSEDPSGGFLRPRPSYRLNGSAPPDPRPAPGLGADAGFAWDGPVERPTPAGQAPLPLSGLKIVDTTTWWAGPSASHVLALLGADVIHVESVQAPDGARMVGGMFAGEREEWWECGTFFLQSNTNKRDITLNLSDPRGLEVLEKLVADADVMIENFSPRVMDGFGVSWERIQALNPRCSWVRMPAFGLDGPWRDNVGFAQTMEQLSGLAWMTGHADDQPRIQRGPCDPLAGTHATFATLVALAERDATGRGSFVECTMVEGALNAASEQLVEYTAFGNLMERAGNRGTNAAPQGLYPCAGHDAAASPRWLALSVATDAQWHALLDTLGQPAWSAELRDADLRARMAAHDKIDEQLLALFAERDRDETIDALVAAGVPAGRVVDPREISDHPQFVARGFFETMDHPVVGEQRYTTAPFRYRSVERWLTRPAPTMGQHNHEVLASLGYDEEAIAALEADRIIGTKPARL